MKRADSLANAGHYAEALNLTLHLIPHIEKSGQAMMNESIKKVIFFITLDI